MKRLSFMFALSMVLMFYVMFSTLFNSNLYSPVDACIMNVIAFVNVLSVLISISILSEPRKF